MLLAFPAAYTLQALAGIVFGGLVRGIWRSRAVLREILLHRGKQ
jgi:hypothetical protein